MTALVVVAIVSLAVTVWVYAGYPLLVALLARVHPRARRRAPQLVPVSVIVAAHNEEGIIGTKVANILASRYPAELLEVIVVSDGSTDGTVAAARAAGATLVIPLARVGKLRALNHAVSRARGAVLVFTDADSQLEPGTLAELTADFADPAIGAVAANEVHVVEENGVPVARGEGLYWRYEQAIKRWEDRAGNTVSASGRCYAIRRDVFVASTQTASTDDFVISTQAIRAGLRLAFDEDARVLVYAPADGGTELRRKVRVMNRGLRGALSLAAALAPFRRPAYLMQLLFHKILRRTVGFFLLALLIASLVLAVHDARWWALLAPQVALYALAAAGALGQAMDAQVAKPLWVAYYFCLSNLAAMLAVCSLATRTRYEMWDPALARGSLANVEATP